MITEGITLAIILAHIMGHKEQYIGIASSFIVTYSVKKVIKILDGDIADTFAMGGYALTVTLIIGLLASFVTPNMAPEGGTKAVGGWTGKLIDKFIKH